MRIQELDYLKCVLIMLMVTFHLVYIGDGHPYAKQVVYTFHMPAFLLISGYLMNVAKPWKVFLRTIFWFFVPYVVMESGYTVMASVLPIREHIDQLTVQVFLEKLLLRPLGPYWYLHTLILCGLTYYGVFSLPRLSLLTRHVLTGIVFALYARLHLVELSYSYYMLAGIVIRHSGLSFLQVFRPSWLSVVAFAMLAAFPQNLHAYAPGGVLMVYLAMSILLVVFPFVTGRCRAVMLFLGRNTLPLFLFSPVFTILCKPLVPYLQFDPTDLLFLVVSLTFCLSGSVAIAWLMDRLHVSPFFFGTAKSLR